MLSKEKIFLNEYEDTYQIEYILYSLTIIPPLENGCYINIYYEDTILEDKIYLSSAKQTKSEFGHWTMAQPDKGGNHARDVYNIIRTEQQKHPNQTRNVTDIDKGNVCCTFCRFLIISDLLPY